jgi:two-component SAPR family response regulator
MKIMLVESDSTRRKNLEKVTGQLMPEDSISVFSESLEALAVARNQEFDIAIINTDMPEMSGTDLGEYLGELYPLINIIFVSSGTEYAYKAMAMHASGYIKGRITRENLQREFEDLRHPAVQRNEKRVFAQTFGNFELFADGSPVAFKYSKTKEIVALLVNNKGAQTTNGEIIASLWEEDGDPEKKASYLSNLRQDLQNTLTGLKLNGIILKQRGSMAIATDKIECDLYDYLDNRANSKYTYMGDYMNQYSWAEFMHAELDELSYAE